MTACEHDDFRTQRQDRSYECVRLTPFVLCRRLYLLVVPQVLCVHGQYTRLGNIRRHDTGAWQDLGYECALGVAVEQPDTGLADHHRIDDHRRLGGKLLKRKRHRMDGLDAAKHPHLDRIHADVRDHSSNLGEDNICRYGVNSIDTERVLCSDRGDRTHAVHPTTREGLEVGLYARAPAGI